MTKKKRKKEKTSAQANNKNQSRGFAARRVEGPSTEILYYEMSSPFEGMIEDEVVELTKKSNENSDQQFETYFKILQKRILQVEPCSLLSFFAYYGLTTSSDINREWTEKNPILQHHVEFLQGLLLQHSQDSFDFRPALPQDFDESRQLVQDVTGRFPERHSLLTDPSTTTEPFHKLIAIETIRIETQAVRNWGYPQQVKRIVSDLFSSLDDTIEQRIGVRVVCLVEMWFKILDVVESRINQHWNLVMPALGAKNIETAIKEYYQAFPDLTSSPEDLSAFVQEKDLTLDGLRAIIFSQSDLGLKHIYTLTLDTFVDAYPKAVAPEALKNVLDAWSLSFGDLSDCNPEHLFLGNPVWQKPLIKLEV